MMFEIGLGYIHKCKVQDNISVGACVQDRMIMVTDTQVKECKQQLKISACYNSTQKSSNHSHQL
jgi:hypothetical protein